VIPGSFEYHRPGSLAEAVGLLSSLGDEVSLLAGGHSLIPMMKLRMAAPEHLVDLQAIAEMRGIEVSDEGVRIGAMVTQHELIADEALAGAVPLLREAALQIADPQVRYVGTVGGNVANGDPGNDMPGLMQCLDASYEAIGPDGTRTLSARAFYHGAYDTALGEGEILVAIRIPRTTPGAGHAYEKQKRKIGDYATAAAAVLIGGEATAVAMTNLADRPIFVADAGPKLAAGDVDGAVAAALSAIEPADDMRGPAEFKRHVAGVMLRRAIARAQDRMG